MKAARLAKLTPLLIAPLAAMALAAPASAASAGPHRPAINNAMAGFLWSGSTAPSGNVSAFYSYDSLGGHVSVTTSSPGVYVASFPGLGSVAVHSTVQVTPYDTSHTCAVVSWGRAGANLDATVACFNASGGQSPAEFTLIVTHLFAPPAGAFASSWVYTGTGTLTGGYQYNSSGAHNSVTNPTVGHYVVKLPGPASSGTHGTVMVSAYGDEGGSCEAASWRGTAAGQVVNVNCYSSAGAFQQRQFVITYAATNNLMAQNHRTDANALANGTTSRYVPAVQFDSAPGAHVSIVRRSTGRYLVTLAGSQGNANRGGDVQVSAIGVGNAHCGVTSWAQGPTPTAWIRCYNGHQIRVDAAFTVNWVVA